MQRDHFPPIASLLPKKEGDQFGLILEICYRLPKQAGVNEGSY